MSIHRRRTLFCYLMVAPALFLVLTLGVYPMLDSLRLAVLQYDLMRIPTEGTPFVGLRNFETIFQDARFLQTLRNTLVFVVIAVGSVIFLGLLIAQVLNLEFPGRGTLRSAVLIPWVIPPVVASAIWMWVYQPDRSPINQVLRELGLITMNIRFLTDATNTWGWVNIPMLAVSSVRVWNGLPFVTVMILAGLQSISSDIYEAAEIDGAGTLDKFRYVTIPMLRPVLAILITLLTIGGIGHFEMNYIMTGGGPNNLTNVLAVMAYQQAFTLFRFDLASAISSVILVITAIIAGLYIRDRIREQ
ncbi:MAG: sugar ABC transporter permease [Caldilineaceae bacterium]|nr:sugar ABC transporter permease [Caldilineaceae bacterium]